MYHQKGMPYHPRENGTIDAFNKILENSLTKVCNINRNDLDVHITMVLWAYRTTYKKLTSKTPFWLLYGEEAVMLMEYILPSLRIVAITEMVDSNIMEEWLVQLLVSEEDLFLAGFHQQVQKSREKAWPDRHIKQRTFKNGDLVLMYENKFNKFLGNF